MESATSTDIATTIVTAFVNEATPPITVQDQGLTAGTGTDPGTLYAKSKGIPVGYQMLDVVYGVTGNCPMAKGLDAGTPCSETVLRDAVDNGITNGGAQWLEIYKEDVQAYPATAQYAHTKLTGAP